MASTVDHANIATELAEPRRSGRARKSTSDLNPDVSFDSLRFRVAAPASVTGGHSRGGSLPGSRSGSLAKSRKRSSSSHMAAMSCKRHSKQPSASVASDDDEDTATSPPKAVTPAPAGAGASRYRLDANLTTPSTLPRHSSVTSITIERARKPSGNLHRHTDSKRMGELNRISGGKPLPVCKDVMQHDPEG